MIEKYFAESIMDLLNSFPFALSGYQDPDLEYAKYFDRLCSYHYLFPKTNFFISGFAKLKEHYSLANTDIEKWETESLKYFLFEDLYSGLTEEILSLYIATLNYFTPEKRVVNIISSNVFNSINIQVELSNEINSLNFRYDKGNRILFIKFPEEYFNREIKIGPETISDLNWPSDFLVSKDVENFGSFSINRKIDTDEEYNSLISQVFVTDSMDEIKNTCFKSNSVLTKALNNSDVTSIDIISFSFASALLCKIFDSKILYFVSTANYDNGKFSSLGAMGIGVPTSRDVSVSERLFYRLMVDHIGANLAVQIMKNNNRELFYKNKRQIQAKLLGKFDREVLFLNHTQASDSAGHKDISHGSNPVTQEHINAWHKFRDKNINELHKCGLSEFITRVELLLQLGEKVDRHFFTEFHVTNDSLKTKCKFYTYAKGNDITISIKGESKPKVDSSLPDHFIRFIEKDNQNPRIQENSENKPIESWTQNNCVFIQVKYKNNINIRGLHNGLSTRTTKGGFVKYLRDHYERMLTAGNFYICKPAILEHEFIREETFVGDYIFSCFHDLYKDGDIARSRGSNRESVEDISDILYVFEYKST